MRVNEGRQKYRVFFFLSFMHLPLGSLEDYVSTKQGNTSRNVKTRDWGNRMRPALAGEQPWTETVRPTSPQGKSSCSRMHCDIGVRSAACLEKYMDRYTECLIEKSGKALDKTMSNWHFVGKSFVKYQQFHIVQANLQVNDMMKKVCFKHSNNNNKKLKEYVIKTRKSENNCY